MRISDWSSDVCSSDLFAHKARSAPTAVLHHQTRGQASRDRREWRRHILPATVRHRCRQDEAESARHSFAPTSSYEAPCGYCRHADCRWGRRSEEHTSELQSLLRITYAVFCLKKKIN